MGVVDLPWLHVDLAGPALTPQVKAYLQPRSAIIHTSQTPPASLKSCCRKSELGRRTQGMAQPAAEKMARMRNVPAILQRPPGDPNPLSGPRSERRTASLARERHVPFAARRPGLQSCPG